MTIACTNANCTYTTTGICARKAEFANPEVDCFDLLAGRKKTIGGRAPSVPPPRIADVDVDASDLRVSDNATSNDDALSSPGRFWSGLALGGDEAAAMLLDSRTRLFTLMGERHRGKTCFLTALYIQLANGYTSGFPWRFCGSRSLQGFQRLSDAALQWRGGEDRILPRTTYDSYRQTGFLHLGLKQTSHRNPKMVHTLLTDMPGEWFEGWIEHGVDGLPQTLEFLPRSDGFMIAIDAPLLLRDRKYAKNVVYLLERLKAFLSESTDVVRPVALVLTKFDKIAREIPIPAIDDRRQSSAWGALQTRLDSILRQMHELTVPWDIFPSAAFSRPSAQPVGVLAPLAFLLEKSVPEKSMACTFSKPEYRSSFFDVFREEGPA